MKFEPVKDSDMVSTWITRLNEIINAFKLVTHNNDGLMLSKDKEFLDSIPELYTPLRGEIPSVKTWTKAEVIPSTKETFYLNVESSNAIVMELLTDAVVDLVAGTRDVFSEKIVSFIPHSTNEYTVTLKTLNEVYSSYVVKPDGNPLVLKVIFAAKKIFIQEV